MRDGEVSQVDDDDDVVVLPERVHQLEAERALGHVWDPADVVQKLGLYLNDDSTYL